MIFLVNYILINSNRDTDQLTLLAATRCTKNPSKLPYSEWVLTFHANLNKKPSYNRDIFRFPIAMKNVFFSRKVTFLYDLYCKFYIFIFQNNPKFLSKNNFLGTFTPFYTLSTTNLQPFSDYEKKSSFFSEKIPTFFPKSIYFRTFSKM